MSIQRSCYGHRYRQGRRAKVHVSLLPALVLSITIASPASGRRQDLKLASPWAPVSTAMFCPSYIPAPRLPRFIAVAEAEGDGYNVGRPRPAVWPVCGLL